MSDEYGEWISVKDRLPKLETYTCSVGINFCDIYGSVYQGYAVIILKDVSWYSYEHRGWILNVTSWMPLPKPPKE